MKMQIVRDLLRLPVSLRSAWLINRACSPMWLSPISPSISARGTSAATVATLPQFHDRPLADLLFDLPEGHLECLLAVHLEPLSCLAARVVVGGEAVDRNLTTGCDTSLRTFWRRRPAESHACDLMRTDVRQASTHGSPSRIPGQPATPAGKPAPWTVVVSCTAPGP